jgi:hypothetical protein
MFRTIVESLKNWNKQNNDRSKLQHAYITTAVIMLVLAGLTSLINYSLGQSILLVALASAAIFVINAIAWALLQSFVLAKVSKKSSSKK